MADIPLDAARSNASAPTIAATMQQAYDLTMNVSVIGAKNIPTQILRACRPRQGAEEVDKDPVELAPPLRHWLLEANKAVVAWLARDARNVHAYLADPVAALEQAGVKMEREHQKSLARLREQLGASQAVVPGMQLRSITTKAGASRVRPIESANQPARADDDCGCDDKRRG